MAASRRATSQAGASTSIPFMVEMLVLLLASNIVLLLGGYVVPHTLHPRRKAPTLLCLQRGTISQMPPGSPNRLRHLMEIKLAVGPSSKRKTSHCQDVLVLRLLTIRVR